MTARIALRLENPAKFLAIHVYSPARWAETESITKNEIFFPLVDMLMSGCVLCLIGSPFRVHCILIGLSPFKTLQVAETCSPQFAGSSPRVIGPTSGGTVIPLIKINELFSIFCQVSIITT